MINSASKSTIANIFPPDNPLKYTIPKYQREYTWVRENWDDLLDDIEESDSSHFVGSIICIYKGMEPNSQFTLYEVIDGQQRLTTVSLLYSAIYKLLKDLDDNVDEELKNELWSLKQRLIQKTQKSETKLELSSQNNNFPDYKSVLSEIGVLDFQEPVLHKGNRKIFKAYRHFLSRLENYNKEQLLALLNKINNVTLVRIEVDSTSDAFMLFESLNNRGIPLSAVDLIKNKLLSEVEKSGESADSAFVKWENFLSLLDDDYSIQERFLRQYYNVFKYDGRVKVEGVTKATKSVLIKVYEELIERDLNFIFDDLISKANIYSRYSKFTGDEFEKELQDLENVKAAPGYALLLFLISVDADKETVRDTIKNLVKYFIRRNVTDFPNTRNLDQIFINLIEQLSNDLSNLNSIYISNYLFDKDRFSSLQEFEEKLRGDMYETNIDSTRFILASIEEKFSGTKERKVDFWERDKGGKLIWSIEHIFPEGANIPNAWVDMVGNGDKQNAKEVQENLVHKFGNLTLTGYNQNLSNFEFIKKRDRTDSVGRSIGYKNGLYLNKELAEKTEWKADDIEKRTGEIIKQAIEIFKVDGE